MRIYFERTGGFVGNIKTRIVDTVNLPESEVYTLEQMIEVADFFHIPCNLDSSKVISLEDDTIFAQNYSQRNDCFQYELTVEDKDKQHTIVFSETSIPDNLKPLFDWLNNVST